MGMGLYYVCLYTEPLPKHTCQRACLCARSPSQVVAYNINVKQVDCAWLKQELKNANSPSDKQTYTTNLNTAFGDDFCSVAKSCLPPGKMKTIYAVTEDEGWAGAACSEGLDTDCAADCKDASKGNRSKTSEECFCYDDPSNTDDLP